MYRLHYTPRANDTSWSSYTIHIKHHIPNYTFISVIDFTSISLQLPQININLDYIYAPPHEHFSFNSLSHLISQHPHFFMGYFNSESRCWNWHDNKQRSSAVLYLIQHHNLSLHAPTIRTDFRIVLLTRFKNKNFYLVKSGHKIT